MERIKTTETVFKLKAIDYCVFCIEAGLRCGVMYGVMYISGCREAEGLLSGAGVI